MISNRSSSLLFFVLITSACSDLEPIDANQCGNKVTELAREDCDGEPNCGAPSTEAPCRFVCVVAADCPTGFGCGVDGVCRQHAGSFEVVNEVDSVTLFAQAGDLDGDRRADLFLTSNDRSVAEFYDDDFNVVTTVIEREPEGVAPLVAPLTFDDDGKPDAQVDVAVTVEVGGNIGSGLAVDLSQSDRTLTPNSYASIVLPTESAYGVTVSAVEPLHQQQVVGFVGEGNVALLVGIDDQREPFPFYEAQLPDVPVAPNWLSGAAAGQLRPDSACEEVVFVHGNGPLEYRQNVYVLEPCQMLDNAWVWSIPPTTETITGLAAPISHPNALQAPLAVIPHAYNSVFLADREGDGDLDIFVAVDDEDHPIHFIENDLVAVAYGAPQPELDIVKNGETGGPVAALKVCADEDGGPQGGGILLAIADLNDDQKLDVISDDAFWISHTLADGITIVYELVEACLGWGNVAIADYDKSGTLDIAASRIGEAGIEVLMNAGDGSFSFRNVTTEREVLHLEAGDFDGDFVADLAWVEVEELPTPGDFEHATFTVAAAFGATSAGFGEPRELGTLESTRQMISGRLAGGDAVDDLVVLTQTDVMNEFGLAFFLGSASRNIVSPFVLEVVGGGPGSRTTVDIIEVAQGTFFSDAPTTATVLLGSEGLGDDTPRSLWRLDASGDADLETDQERRVEGIGDYCTQCSLVPVDLDGDGLDELAVFGEGGARIYEAGPRGDGAYFVERSPVDTGGLCFSSEGFVEPLVVDIDGDTLREVVLLANPQAGCDDAGAAEIVVFWNDGNGTLDLDTATRITSSNEELEIRAFAAIDLDRDGRLELIGSAVKPFELKPDASGGVRVLTLNREETLDLLDGDEVVVDADVLPHTPDNLVAADFNGDGVTDLAASDFRGHTLLAGVPVR